MSCRNGDGWYDDGWCDMMTIVAERSETVAILW